MVKPLFNILILNFFCNVGCMPKKSSSSTTSSKLVGSWKSICALSSKVGSSSQDTYVIENDTITWFKIGYTSLDCAGEKEYQYRILVSYGQQVVPEIVPVRLNLELTFGKSYFTPLTLSGLDVGRAVDSNKTWVLNEEQEISNSNFEVGKKIYDIAEVGSEELCLGHSDETHDKTSPEKRPKSKSQDCFAKLTASSAKVPLSL
jgi:hypothetical protein